MGTRKSYLRVVTLCALVIGFCSLADKSREFQGVAQGTQSRQLNRQTESVRSWPIKAKRWALIIGVDQYRDGQINALKGSVNDAHNLANALVSYAGFPQDQVIVLTTDQPEERQPTRINILTYLSNLASLVPKDGLLLVSFAGHGIERGGQAYLIPSDARLSHDVSLLEESAVSVTRMHDRIKAIGVGQVIVLLDACRNDPGGRADAPNKMSAAYAKFNFDVRNREVRAFATLYATEIGHRAYEYTEKRQGYFTWAVVEALKGGAANEKGEVTLSALVKYIQDNVAKRIAIDLGTHEQQKPFATIDGYRADELIIAISAPIAASAGNVSTALVDPAAIELSFWESIKNSNNPADFKLYLEKYPSGSFAQLAKLRVESASSTSISPLPTVDDILRQYLKAVGGQEAITRLTTLVRKGSYEVNYGGKKIQGEVELYEKRPGKSLLIIKAGRAVSKEVYDGKNGWLYGTGTGTKAATPKQLETHRRSNAWDSGDIEQLKELYSKVIVKERKKIDERDVFIVETTTPDGKVETLYFDSQTMLAYRWDMISDSVSVQQGVAFPTQIYLEDYLEVNGVKIAMTIRQVQTSTEATIKFDLMKIKFNVPLDDKLFGKP